MSSRRHPGAAKSGAPDKLSEEAKGQWADLNGFFARWFQTPDGEYLRAYHRFETADEFGELVKRLIQKWVDDNVPRNRAVIWPIETKGSPFRSLQPFDARHSTIFFGRDRKVTRAIEQLQSVALPRSAVRSAPKSVPFLLIVGESGAGKSSLMRAGVAPRLTALGVTPQIDLWRVAVARIGDDPDPFLTLANALLVEDDKAGGQRCQSSRVRDMRKLWRKFWREAGRLECGSGRRSPRRSCRRCDKCRRLSRFAGKPASAFASICCF